MATKAPFSLVIPPLNKDSKAAPLQAKNTRNPPQTLKPLGVWRDLGAEPLTLARRSMTCTILTISDPSFFATKRDAVRAAA